jgi:DNA-binding cell septation regulator SpoVG
MEIMIEWQEQSKYPQFNLSLASKSGNDPFLVVKGCRIVSGKEGEFVYGPSTKGNNDKYWNHTYMSKDFSAVVLEKAKECQPKQQQSKPAKQQADDNFDSDQIPF